MNIQHSTFDIQRRTPPPSAAPRRLDFSSLLNVEYWLLNVPRSHRCQQGVALVVTLIMLSIITFLAVAFLALSRRERSSVTNTTDQNIARGMMEAALSKATADEIAGMIARGSMENYGARVMTNFVNPAGFTPGLGTVNPTNVNFDWLAGRITPIGYFNLTHAQRTELLGNLLYDPRVPVLVRLTNGATEFRFYLDLNRNGRFDPSLSGLPGDPEWCGVLERAGLPHAGNNPAIGRFTYYVQPIGHSLDLNAIHNAARTRALTAAGDGYLRNQGVGTWEINLGAFLADLNVGFWGTPPPDIGTRYDYNPIGGVAPRGSGFEDAVQFLSYRYARNYGNLPSFASLYPIYPPQIPVPPADIISKDFIDGYSSGPLWTSLSRLQVDGDTVRAFLPWAGAENPSAFFSIQDLFEPEKVGPEFVKRLVRAGTSNDVYNAYTYYRLIEQLGTSSAPERGKINLNYDNRVKGVAVGAFTYVASTNFLPWQPIDFFTNAAARLIEDLSLRDTNNRPISLNYIPLWPNNYYTPSVHRALQLAANIYDASTNRWPEGPPYLPSVFRPQFAYDGTNVFITNYVEQVNSGFNNLPARDLTIPADRDALRTRPNDNVHGVPLVIGAKKGLPNFNEFSIQNIIDVSRRLQFARAAVGAPVTETNQQYLISIRHNVGMELWNSYASNYSRPVSLVIPSNRLTLILTNEVGTVLGSSVVDLPAVTMPIPASAWRGYTGGAADASFVVPFKTTHIFVDKSAVVSRPAAALMTTNRFERNFPTPRLFLSVSANVRCLISDSTTGNVIDYVNLAGLGGVVNIMAEVMGNNNLVGDTSVDGKYWIPDRARGTERDEDPPMGVINQIFVSMDSIPSSETEWASYNANPIAGLDRQKAIDEFLLFFGLSPKFLPRNLLDNTKLITQAPFTPTRKLKQNLTWQANDPLVHYTSADLNDIYRTNKVDLIKPPTQTAFTNNLGQLNERYKPWGGSPLREVGQAVEADAYNVALKDPLVRRSDNWDFPTNKFPNVGWLGRVHRGTPWQTIFLKSTNVTDNVWRLWSGNDVVMRDGNNILNDYELTMPSRDRRVFDHFTAAVNDNATLGQLSVNQTNLAAWSAVLSGVVVLSNSLPDATLAVAQNAPQFAARVIAPAALDPSGVSNIVAGIVRTRNTFNDDEFSRLGDILAVPELTVNSPFLNRATAVQLRYGIPDTVYERIPEQIMGLLHHGPSRFVVYAFGQALKPAPNSLVAGSQLCTNYQVTAEIAARAVVRVEGSSSQPRTVIESFNLLPPD